MLNQQITFETGITVDFASTNIVAKHTNGWNVSLDNSDIGGLSYEVVNCRTLTWLGLAVRLFLFGGFCQILIPILFVKNGWSGFAFTGTPKDIFFTWLAIGILIICWGVAAVIFFSAVIESFCDINFIDRIMDRFFSTKLYSVKIGNKSGIDAVFYASINEEDKIASLESNLKIIKSQIVKPDASYTSLDELKKLNELYKEGVINEMEFALKKEQFLKQ